MECLKCGRETAGAEVFCTECLKEMEKNPVNSNTPVVIHHRKEPQRRTPQKKAPKSEEVIAGLNRKVQRLRAAVAVLALLLTVSLAAMGYLVWAERDDLDIGFNYGTITYPSEGGNR